uniref:Kelch domain-containing protein 10 n=1 Tax=Ditylenchus dipsaci TaxID=166011 RepID=A0A915E7U9_9BILA
MSLDWACPLKKLDDETWDPYENAESTEPRARHLANLHLTFDYLYVLGGRFCSPYNIWRYNLLTREWKLLEVNGKILNAVHIDCRKACANGIFKIYQIKWSLITEKWEWTCIGGHDTADKDVQNVFQLFSMKYFNTFIHGNFLYILAFVLPEFEPDREIENLDEIEAVKHYMVRFDLSTHTFCVLNLLPDRLHGFPLKQYGQMNFMADGDFYLIGGLEWNIFTKDYSQRFKPMNEIWRLDLVKYQWTRISLAMKYPVVNSACKYNYFDGCIYTFGG